MATAFKIRWQADRLSPGQSSIVSGQFAKLGHTIRYENSWLVETNGTAESRRFSALLFKISAAAAVLLMALTGIWMVNRQWTSAESQSLPTVTPLAGPLPSPTVAEEPLSETADRNRNDVPTNQLADAEPPRCRKPPHLESTRQWPNLQHTLVSDSISSMEFPCRRIRVKPSLFIDEMRLYLIPLATIDPIVVLTVGYCFALAAILCVVGGSVLWFSPGSSLAGRAQPEQPRPIDLDHY